MSHPISTPLRHGRSQSDAFGNPSSSPLPFRNSLTNSTTTRPASRGSTVMTGTGFAGVKYDVKQSSSDTFEWTVKDLEGLQKNIDGQPDMVLHDLLAGRVILADKFKVDVMVNTHPAPSTPLAPSTLSSPLLTDDNISAQTSSTEPPEPVQGLTLFLALVSPELVAMEYPISTGIFVGIRPLEVVGKASRWFWSEFEEIAFDRELEYWECQLPVLSSVFTHPQIQRQSAFSLCIQVNCPPTPIPVLRPGTLMMPQDLMDGLRSSLDNPRTADVKFMCMEYAPVEEDGDSEMAPLSGMTDLMMVRRFRKRVIYAQSVILKARSEYMEDLLSGSFKEGVTQPVPSPPPHRTTNNSNSITHTINCSGPADFVTMHGIITYLYTNEIEFAIEDDVRAVVARRDVSEATLRDRGGLGGEWDWRVSRPASLLTDEKAFMSTASVTSSVGTSISRRGISGDRVTPKVPTTVGSSTSNSQAKLGSNTTKPTSSSQPIRRGAPPPPPPTTSTRSSKPTAPPISPSDRSAKHIPAPTSYPTHFHPSSRLSSLPTPDPHPHPAPAPGPASALSVYEAAHRYRLEGLMALAKEHIMSCISPATAMPLLLAVYCYEELYGLVMDWVLLNWAEVQAEEEFLICCKEISAGYWAGETGGLVLHALFRRL